MTMMMMMMLFACQEPLSTISGNGAINSGRPVAQASFLHTFDDPGDYTVASVGAPGCAGNISVVEPGYLIAGSFCDDDYTEITALSYYLYALIVCGYQCYCRGLE